MKFKIGVKVRVKTDVSYSMHELGGGDKMVKMQNGVFEIIDINPNCIKLNGKSFGDWWFKKRDLLPYITEEELLVKIKQQPPVLFDPKNIEVT